MRFVATDIAGAYVIETERHTDERGAFARVFCARELADHGLDARLAQASLSWNKQRGTLRGLHFQAAPHEEAKTVRVVAGAIFDVLVDLREGSATRGRWFGTELTADNDRALHIPAGCAHGFITLADDSLVHYSISSEYHPEASVGFRWDDPSIGIHWPIAPTCISERDRALPWLPR